MESHTFTSAVRGYNILPKILETKRERKADLPFTRLEIRAIDSLLKTVNESGEILGHLPKEISRVTKYFLNRGASMYCRLSSEHYRRSPLVQGRLEIECEVVINSRATMLQSRLTAPYLDLVKDLYTEPAEGRVVGNLFNFAMTLPPMVNTPAPVKRKKKAVAINASGNRDIREMVGASQKKKTPKIIVIDDE